MGVIYLILVEHHLKSDASHILPLYSLSILSEWDVQTSQIQYTCIILLACMSVGIRSKYIMHVIRLHKNRSGFYTFSSDLLVPFRTSQNKQTLLTCTSTLAKTDHLLKQNLTERLLRASPFKFPYHMWCVCTCACPSEDCGLLVCQKWCWWDCYRGRTQPLPIQPRVQVHCHHGW